jgi:hypothetical protein
MRYKKIAFIFVLVCIFSNLICQSTYADVPYHGYTYNVYGRPVPTAVSYAPEKYITGVDMGVGELNNPQDMFVHENNELYILDSGNKRVVILDRDLKVKNIIEQITDKDGNEYVLNNPSGIFVTDEKVIFIADTDNAKVISIDEDGNILKIFTKPISPLFPQNVEFKPTKVVVNKAQDVYVISTGVFQGAVVYDKDSNFTGFYGTNRVQIDTRFLSDYFWRTFFMNKEQKRKTIRYVPTTFTNFHIDKDGFVYVCSKDDTSRDNVLKKLNSLGNNILRGNDRLRSYGDMETTWFQGFHIRSAFVDVNVDDEGFINVLDSTKGRIFQYDQDSNLIAIFGNKSNQVGAFDSPVAIDNIDGKIIVLDEKRGDITFYGLTEFGQWVHTAVKLYNDGLYEESMEPWKEVLKRDNKLEIAYVGIGKALLRSGDYREAMKNFKKGYAVKDYSKAYGLYQAELIRNNIGSIASVIALVFIAAKLIKKFNVFKKFNKGAKKINRKVKERLYGAG